MTNNKTPKKLLCKPRTVEELFNLSNTTKRWLEKQLGLQIIETPEKIYVELKETSDD